VNLVYNVILATIFIPIILLTLWNLNFLGALGLIFLYLLFTVLGNAEGSEKW